MNPAPGCWLPGPFRHRRGWSSKDLPEGGSLTAKRQQEGEQIHSRPLVYAPCDDHLPAQPVRSSSRSGRRSLRLIHQQLCGGNPNVERMLLSRNTL